MRIGLALSVGADGETRVTGHPSPEILSFPVENTPSLFIQAAGMGIIQLRIDPMLLRRCVSPCSCRTKRRLEESERCLCVCVCAEIEGSCVCVCVLSAPRASVVGVCAVDVVDARRGPTYTESSKNLTL